MRLTFDQFKKEVAETKKRIVSTFSATNPNTPQKAGKVSQSRLKTMHRAFRTRPRWTCKSFRYQQKHQWQLRRLRRWDKKLASSPLKKAVK